LAAESRGKDAVIAEVPAELRREKQKREGKDKKKKRKRKKKRSPVAKESKKELHSG